MSKTDQELDDLEARLADQIDSARRCGYLAVAAYFTEAKTAIAELRKKNARLENALVIALGQINLDYGTGPDPKRADEVRDIIEAVLEDKENTQ